MVTSVPNTISTRFTHPRGLMTLFFTEMWERASYYGMRALLVLFLAAPVVTGGMGLDDKTATAIYGIYTACIYLSALPGGWIADRLLGMQRAVWYGGIIITLGHFCMALPWNKSFFLGLILIVVGTGLLKPCISTLVGELYDDDLSARRDAGFSIYYMGINLGAIIGPLICGYLGENVNWHYGFAASGIGMALGLAQYRMTLHRLGDAGIHIASMNEAQTQRDWWRVRIGSTVFLAFVAISLLGLIEVNAATLATYGGGFIVALGLAYFCSIYFRGNITPIEKDRMKAAGTLFIFSAVFWSGFEQAGSSFNLFGERYTDRFIGGWEMPTSWLQSANAFFVITLAPFFGAIWVWLARRNLNPSSPVKFALGLLQLGLGFGVIALAATYVVQGETVLPSWLVLTYLLHTMGELCLSPIGLSMTTKLAPKGFKAQMMATFFISYSLGNILAGLLAGHLGHDALSDMPSLFAKIMFFCVGSAAILFVIRKPLERWMRGVH